ncbi:hypothetical protein VPNG_04268 [Cytospora leucostoma]|uniref:Uncharacterized protein n=1 Tax=Cytospora leucostoma TaxID=1230097 RepID=A0A423XDG4_9PEZI|nr:hypothetical protein VPNG_04268 [Cytospora leucostoma]
MVGFQAINMAGTQAINVAGTQAPTTSTGYNKCPSEVREMIIANLVVTPDGISFHDTSGRVCLPISLTGPKYITPRQRRNWLANYFRVSKDFSETAVRLFLTRNTFHLKAGCAAYDNVVHIHERGRLPHADLRMRIRHVVLHAEMRLFPMESLDHDLATSVRNMITAGSLRTIEVRMYGSELRAALTSEFEVTQEIKANGGVPPRVPILCIDWSMQTQWEKKACLLVELLLHPGLEAASLKVLEEQHPAAWCLFSSSDSEESDYSYHSHCLDCTSFIMSPDDDDALWLDVDVYALARRYDLLPGQ